MFAIRRWHLGALALVGFGFLAALPSRQARAEDPAAVQIGLPQSLFRDFPKVTVEALMPTFTKLMESQTGMRGKVVLLAGPDEVGRCLTDNKVQIGVFHGFEFAWAQTKDPALRPLCVAIKQNGTLSAAGDRRPGQQGGETGGPQGPAAGDPARHPGTRPVVPCAAPAALATARTSSSARPRPRRTSLPPWTMWSAARPRRPWWTAWPGRTTSG